MFSLSLSFGYIHIGTIFSLFSKFKETKTKQKVDLISSFSAVSHPGQYIILLANIQTPELI